ncbi:MAG: hypothetical protein Ct9H300mP23_05900 [Nitrospinota bacterium]|nr:MAG: hypothetical protein Ct9H300mP23_05900 [Nitrospinota bacterium]
MKNSKNVLPNWLVELLSLKWGPATETEIKGKKARVEDALHATRAAVEEGIIPGGGVAFIRALGCLDKIRGDPDFKLGSKLFPRALEEPLRQIASNAGEEGTVKMRESQNPKKGNWLRR